MKVEWVPVTTVTPQRDSERVEIDSPIPSSRIRLHRDALARLLAGADVPGPLLAGLRNRQLIDSEHVQPHPATPSAEGLAAWREHGWGLSMSYYLWSRRYRFQDDGDDGAERRTATLTGMALREPCPQPSPLDDCPTIALDRTTTWQLPPLGEVLERRRSSLKPQGSPIRLTDLSILLLEGARRFRASRIAATVPGPVTNLLISYGSAIDIYVLVYRSDDLDPGVYRFDPPTCALALLRKKPIDEQARAALLAHPDPRHAVATIVLAADFTRYQWRYRHERALRNLWVDTGRIMQELLVTATALDLTTGITPAVDDTAFLALLGLERQDHQVLHTLTVAGRSAQDATPV